MDVMKVWTPILSFSKINNNIYRIKVSLAIRGGYVPYKSQTPNTKTGIFGLNEAHLSYKWQFFESVNSQNREYQNRE